MPEPNSFSDAVLGAVREWEIDKITYTQEVKSWEVSEMVTIGWNNVLPEPPSNTSNRTMKELSYLSELTKKLTPAEEDLVMMVDDEPLTLFESVIGAGKFDRSHFDRVWPIVDPVIMNLKYQYNRPRPAQLADVFKKEINVKETKTHHTPAYPSGHTAYAAIAAYLYADMYPELSSDIFRQVGLCGHARCLQGVHFPSDNEASMVIAGAVWENVRYELFPELPKKY